MDGNLSVTNYKNIYRKEKSEQAKEYQDFVCSWIAKNYGLVLSIFTSKKYQQKTGESLQGIEIKFDMKMKETGNIYIETGEKAYPRDGEYYPSGIYANDNSWLYFIGNYEKMYVFSKKQLKNICENLLFTRIIADNETKTSTGFLLNTEKSEKYCIMKFNF